MIAPDIEDDLIDTWHRDLLGRGYARSTLQTRRKHVRRAAADLDLTSCTRDDLAGWLADHGDWSPLTRSTVASALRLYFEWLIDTGHRDDNPTEEPAPGDPDLLAAWATWAAANGATAGTLKVWTSYLSRLTERYPLLTATGDDLADWLAEHPDWSQATRRSAHAALRSWFQWAHRHGHRPDDPTELLRRPREPAPYTRVAPGDVVSAALAAGNDDERLMILLGVHAGLRRAEIAAVHRDDLHGHWLTVLGKGDRRRRVPVGREIANLIRQREAWIFPSPRRPGEHLTADNVGRRMARLLGSGWTAHCLRHRYATRAYQGSRDVLAVQALLGHTKSDTTKRYVAMDDAGLTRAARAARSA